MEWMRGRTHAVFPMGDASRVGEARRRAGEIAAGAALDEPSAGRLALIVTALGSNLVRHAIGGELLIAGSEGEVEVLALDGGPGIAAVQRCLADGFSTGGTPGTGLGAVRRLADEFDLHTTVGEGTAIVARVRGKAAQPRMALHIAGVATSAPGETVCGDAWASWFADEGSMIMLADGLGHGAPAAEASNAAVEVFGESRGHAPAQVVQNTHASLRSTRGAALCVLRLDAQADTVTCCGAGNVIARVISGVSDRTLLTQHGTAGLQIRRPEEASVPWPEHAIVVLHSDGLESRWPAARIAPLLQRDPALVAAVLLRAFSRGRDDATVVVARRKETR